MLKQDPKVTGPEVDAQAQKIIENKNRPSLKRVELDQRSHSSSEEARSRNISGISPISNASIFFGNPNETPNGKPIANSKETTKVIRLGDDR